MERVNDAGNRSGKCWKGKKMEREEVEGKGRNEKNRGVKGMDRHMKRE